MSKLIHTPSFPAATFDELLGLFNRLPNIVVDTAPTYPPINVIKDGDKYFVEIAVAGFKAEELDVVVEKHVLTVKGEKAEKDEREYLKRGIATRSFTRQFLLPSTKNIEVHSSKLEHGILTVELEEYVPEEQKPKKIPVVVA